MLPNVLLHLFIMAPLQLGDLIPRGTRVNVFQRIYWVFLLLGTLVGIVVITYMLWKAYKYRDDGSPIKDDEDRPELGELPSGGGGGRKLLLSFSLSAIIVISLIIWTYGTLLYVEQAPAQETNEITVEVHGFQFGWRFVYSDVPGQDNGVESQGELRVPVDRMIRLQVTSDDVMHNFGIPAQRVKTDAIPGSYTETWFRADKTGNIEAQCYELCGAGHSYMTADVVVMEQGEFETWYSQQNVSS